jgi:DNA-binding NarL/FixJ family response regulator
VVQQALDAGADGYLLKDFVLSELEQALRTVLAGNTYLSPRLPSALAPESGGVNGRPALTTRQLEVLRLIAGGASSKEIAKQLAISPKTVEFHRSQMMERLGLHDIASLTLYAERNGLLPSRR